MAESKYVVQFGMVSIPVKLEPAARTKSVSFRQLHDACEKPLRQQWFCEPCAAVVASEHICKGYAIDKAKFVVLRAEDVQALKLNGENRVMEVRQFVEPGAIDPFLFEKAYWIEPDEMALQPFAALVAAMEDTGRQAIVTYVQSGRDRLGLIRLAPQGQALIMHEMYLADEARPYEGAALPPVSDQNRQLAGMLVRRFEGEFNHGEFHDGYRDALNEVIQAKINGQEIPVREVQKAPVASPDLTASLLESVKALETRQAKAPAKAPAKAAGRPEKQAAKKRRTA